MPWKIGSVRITEAPPIRAKAVMMIGRVRALQDNSTASRTSTPFLTSSTAKSTNRIEFLTIIPARAMNPIIEVAVNWALKIR